MKRLILFVLSILMLVSLVAPVSAEEQSATITEEEAKDLIQKSLDFYKNVRVSTDCMDIAQKRELPVYIQYEGWNGISTLESMRYFPVIEEKLPGGSYKSMCDYAETIYVTDIAPEAYKYSDRINAIDTDFWYLFREEENGVMYMHREYNPDFWNGTYEILVWDGFELSNIEGDSNTAKASVSVWIYCGGDVTPAQQRSIECIFQNTDDGWRIAKSDFSTIMATDGYEWLGELPGPPYEPESPSTADPAFDSFVLLPAVSLACLVPAVFLVRRRRKAEI